DNTSRGLAAPDGGEGAAGLAVPGRTYANRRDAERGGRPLQTLQQGHGRGGRLLQAGAGLEEGRVSKPNRRGTRTATGGLLLGAVEGGFQERQAGGPNAG